MSRGSGPPTAWARLLRWLLPRDEADPVAADLEELWETRRQVAGRRAADAWYRRQVMGFVIRLPGGRGGERRTLSGSRSGVVESVRQDLAFTVRQLRRSPAFALLAVVTLGLGIGAAASIFGVVRAVVLEPLPHPEPDRLVEVREVTPRGDPFSTSEPNLLDFREGSRTLAGLAALREEGVSLLGGDEPLRLTAARVSPDFFDVLGGSAALGRTFRPEEGGAEPAPVAVLSHRLWAERFAGSRDVLGRTLTLDAGAVRVVGVMPPGWEPIVEADLWLPQRLSSHADRDDHRLTAVGRLAPGRGVEAAREELSDIQRRLGERFPESNGGWDVDVRPLKVTVVGEERIQAGRLLLGAVGLLLLLACVSVSSLLVARASIRIREMAVRTAVGAGPTRIVRQLFTESLVLALAGGAVGVALAYAAVPALRSLSPPGTPRIDEATVDPAVLVFSLGAALLTGAVFGLAPGVHLLRSRTRDVLAGGSRGGSGGGERLRRALVVIQVAVSIPLLVGTGLLGRSVLRMGEEDPGMRDVAEVLAVPLVLPGPRYDEGRRRAALKEIEDAVGALPGVRAVGSVNIRPFSGGSTMIDLSVEGMDLPPGEIPFANWRAVTPGWFDAAGVTLVAGRTLEPGERGPGAPDAVAVVSRTLAERTWGSPQAALERRLAMSRNSTNWMRVVGVVEDVQDRGLAEEGTPSLFFPEGGWWPDMTVLVRSEAGAAALAPSIRRAVWSVDGALPVPVVEPVAAGLDRTVAGPRFNFVVLATFGGVALVLALMGVYGVTHLAVSRRYREIGVRMALGADAGSVVQRTVLGSGRLALIGCVLGLGLSLLLIRFMEGLLFRTDPLDPRVTAGMLLLALGASVLAAWVPARRATRVDPASVLRAE